MNYHKHTGKHSRPRARAHTLTRIGTHAPGRGCVRTCYRHHDFCSALTPHPILPLLLAWFLPLGRPHRDRQPTPPPASPLETLRASRVPFDAAAVPPREQEGSQGGRGRPFRAPTGTLRAPSSYPQFFMKINLTLCIYAASMRRKSPVHAQNCCQPPRHPTVGHYPGTMTGFEMTGFENEPYFYYN